MIKPNMSVGEIFEDGGLYYIVESVLPGGNYTAKRVEEPVQFTEEVKEEPKEEVQAVSEHEYTKTEINRMPKDELTKLATEKGVEFTEETSGAEIKKALIQKLGL